MTTTYHTDPATVAALVAALRMPESVVVAWLHCEGQDDSQLSPNNPLNIQSGNTPGQTGKHGVTGIYPTLEIGAHWTGWLIDHGPYQNIRNVRGTGDPYQIARAIELSPWAGSHYGATPSTDGCIARQLRDVTPPKPPQAPEFLDRDLNPVPITCHRQLSFPSGTHLYGWPGGPIRRTLTALERFGYVAATAEWVLVGSAGADALVWIPRGRNLLVDDLDVEVGA